MFRYNDVLQADFYEDYFLLAFKSLAWMDWSRSICSGVYARSISFGVCACSICSGECVRNISFGVCTCSICSGECLRSISFAVCACSICSGVYAISILFRVCAHSIWSAVRQWNMKPFSGQIANSDQSG